MVSSRVEVSGQASAQLSDTDLIFVAVSLVTPSVSSFVTHADGSDLPYVCKLF